MTIASTENGLGNVKPSKSDVMPLGDLLMLRSGNQDEDKLSRRHSEENVALISSRTAVCEAFLRRKRTRPTTCIGAVANALDMLVDEAILSILIDV